MQIPPHWNHVSSRSETATRVMVALGVYETYKTVIEEAYEYFEDQLWNKHMELGEVQLLLKNNKEELLKLFTEQKANKVLLN
jgi:hypothetical protein